MSTPIRSFAGSAVLFGATIYTPQTVCPIPSGSAGHWLDANDSAFKFRNADGSDTPVAQGGGVRLIYVDLVATSALATNDYANGTSGIGATLTGHSNGALASVDSVTPTAGMIILVTGEVAQANNGAYVVTAVGSGSAKYVLTRIATFDESAEIKDGTTFVVGRGTVHANRTWKYTGSTGPTVGTTALTFALDPGLMTVDTAQTVTGAKDFAAGTLKADNDSTTDAHTFVSQATQARTATMPDASFIMAQSAVATASTTPGAGGGTAPAFTGTAQALAGYAAYTPPTAEATAGASSLVTDVAISAVALTIAAQPAVPCKLNIYKTDADSSYAATLTIIGKGPAGEPVTEVVSLLATDGTHTYVTANAFATITSATVSALSGNTGADKVAIGQATALGLPIPSGAGSVVVYKEAVGATIASVPVNESAGTVDTAARTVVPTTAGNGTKALHFWFSYTITPAGSVASHTHTGAAHTHTQV